MNPKGKNRPRSVDLDGSKPRVPENPSGKEPENKRSHRKNLADTELRPKLVWYFWYFWFGIFGVLHQKVLDCVTSGRHYPGL